MIVEKKLYLHGSRDGNYEDGEEMGMEGDVLNNYSRSLYEVGFNCKVDTKTGDIEIISVDVGDGGDLFTR